MVARDYLNAALESKNMFQEDGAAAIGWTPAKLSAILRRETLKADDFIALMDAIGMEIEFKDKETGEPLKIKASGYGRRLRGISDGIKFDTNAAEAISNSFYEDGVNEYGKDGRAVELYIDKQGRYFFAEYSINAGEKERIRSTSSSVAAAFIEKYGTDLHTDMKESQLKEAK